MGHLCNFGECHSDATMTHGTHLSTQCYVRNNYFLPTMHFDLRKQAVREVLR